MSSTARRRKRLVALVCFPWELILMRKEARLGRLAGNRLLADAGTCASVPPPEEKWKGTRVLMLGGPAMMMPNDRSFTDLTALAIVLLAHRRQRHDHENLDIGATPRQPCIAMRWGSSNVMASER
jgi:hypothetical protein